MSIAKKCNAYAEAAERLPEKRKKRLKADCVIVAVGHNEFRTMSMMQIKELFKSDLPDEEKVLLDVKSLYRMDELRASGMRFWSLNYYQIVLDKLGKYDEAQANHEIN